MTENYSCKIKPIEPSAYAYWKKYRSYIYKIARDYRCTDPDNVYAESYFFIDRAIAAFNSTRGMAIGAWLFKILRQKVKDYCFKNRHIIHRPQYPKEEGCFTVDSLEYLKEEDGSIEYEPVFEGLSPDEIALRNYLRRELRRAMKMLDPSWEELVKKYYGIDRAKEPVYKIAKDLGVSTACLYEKIRKAKQKMHRYLTKWDKNIGELLDYDA